MRRRRSPVVAAAVILPNRWAESGFDTRLEKLNDSKQLTEAQRENFFQILTSHPDIRYAIAIVDAFDYVNAATDLAFEPISAIFTLDLTTSAGFGIGVLYVLPLLLSTRTGPPRLA